MRQAAQTPSWRTPEHISDPMSSSMLTLQHNLQVQQLSERLDALTPRGGSTKKKGGPTKQQLAQAEEAARIKRDVAFDGGLWQVERMLGQFVCPTHVAAPPARKNPEVASASITINQVKPLTFAEIKENQRLASERLYRGTSFAASSASAAAAARRPIPPPGSSAAKSSNCASTLCDPTRRRESLRLKAEQDMRDKRAACI